MSDLIYLKAVYKNGILTLQRDKYIEDGWYIENFGNTWKVFEIPQYGGEPQYIGHYPSFTAAYKATESLA